MRPTSGFVFLKVWVLPESESMVTDGYVPKNLPTAIVKQEWFAEGYRLLELPPATDAAWHQVWQQFKAGA